MIQFQIPNFSFRSLIVFLILTAGLTVPCRSQLSNPIQELIEKSDASGAFWVIQVRDGKNQLVESLNGEKIIRPASNLKLVSSGAYLEYLGSGFHFTTRLYGKGELQNQTWKGDLLVEGSGDPTINGEFYNGNPLFLFERWASVLKEKGIETVDGHLLGYSGKFDSVPYPEGWEWSDLSFYYAPEISALSFNSNVVDLEVFADGPLGSLPGIQWVPFNTPYVEFVNEQTITSPDTEYDESYRRILGSNRILLRSKLPQGYYETEPLSVHQPARYFMDTFRRYLEREEIEVTGRDSVIHDTTAWEPGSYRLLSEHDSEPLGRIIQWLNRESDNFYTEMLLKKLASEVSGYQGNTERGLVILKEFMSSMDFDTSLVNLKDASGMAPATYIKGGDLNRYLMKVKEKEYFPVLFESLSVSGMNGTLGHRFRNSVVKGNFYGKTGFLSGVRSLSGYLNTVSGDQLTVTIVTNNYTTKTSQVDSIHQKILEYLHLNY